MPSPTSPQSETPAAMATVLSCTYAARAGRAIAFGLPSSKHFRIRYNYWANGVLYENEFFAARPIPQGSVFPVQYDREAPGRAWQSDDAPPPNSISRSALLAVGIGGSVVLSLAWFLLLRGCS